MIYDGYCPLNGIDVNNNVIHDNLLSIQETSILLGILNSNYALFCNSNVCNAAIRPNAWSDSGVTLDMPREHFRWSHVILLTFSLDFNSTTFPLQPCALDIFGTTPESLKHFAEKQLYNNFLGLCQTQTRRPCLKTCMTVHT